MVIGCLLHNLLTVGEKYTTPSFFPDVPEVEMATK